MNNVKKYFLMLSINFLLCIGVSAQSVYPRLEKFIQLKRYTQAYQQAIKLRNANEGDPRFDYLYGFSALQTGHFNEAVFALDRVTIATPRVIRPRLELARAYLKLNNKTAAIKEFNDVLALSPPLNVRKNVLTYLSELNKGGKLIKKSIIKRLASFSIGYDDNINFGADNSEIELPGFGLVKLNTDAIKQKSGFTETTFQFLNKKSTNKVNSAFGLANITHRKYFKKSKFDYSDLDFRVGFSMSHADKQYQFVLRDRPVFLDGSLYSNTLGIDAILRRKLAEGKVISSYMSLENYDNKKFSLTDRKRVVLGAKLDKVNGVNQHQVSFQLGKEFADKKAGKQFSRNIAGISYKFAHKWNAKNRTFLNMDYRYYKHQAPYPLFLNRRKDGRYTIKASHELALSQKTSLIFSAKHEMNESNLSLYDVKRNEVKIGIRYEWD